MLCWKEQQHLMNITMNRTQSVIIASLCISIWVLSCSPSKEEADTGKEKRAKKVNVAKAQPIEYRKEVFGVGTVSFSKEVKLSFKTGGIIRTIPVEEGQSVQAGRLLASLNLKEINTQVANAEIELEKTKRDLQRAEALFADSVATLETVQNARSAKNAAENTLEAAQFNLSHSKIIAPFNGIILKKLAEENELIGQGSPVFLFGTKNSGVKLNLNIPAKEISHINLGDPTTVQFDALESQTFTGKVIERAEMADPYTNTFPVTILVEDDKQQLYSGFIGKATIQTSDKADEALAIPIDALVEANGSTGKVYTLEEGKIQEHEIEILKITADRIIVKNGLNPYDEVITTVGFLQEGDKVIASKL